ncbi:unnamed protein product [Absidia cylindrospora]
MPKRRNSHRPSEIGALTSKASSTSLRYSVYDYSSYSGTYHPNNIYFDTPQDQSSRWSSGSHDGTQFITLRFDQPVVARALLWGKFHRSHVCNVKEFKVFGGMDPNNMSELLYQVLQNHNKPEVFKLRYTYQDLVIPIQYIKIVPVSTFSTNFNYSIWYLEILGVDDPGITRRVLDAYENFKEKETIRLCMKHFRQRNMGDIFQLIKQRSGVELENPLLTRLHTALVKEGDFELAQALVEQADLQYGIFQTFTQNTKYEPLWQQLHPTPTTDGDIPCDRGGHQMCIDSANGHIYLHGGWTGKSNLADFWFYSIKENRWYLISNDTSRQRGPSARSCHQICLDTASKSIFVFGRVTDSRTQNNSAENLQADFYRYYIESNHWEKLFDHTAAHGGPELVFDHQMCVDAASGILYVFGGREVSGNNLHQYSGLYSYDIKNRIWKLIRNGLNQENDDGIPPTATSSSSGSSNNGSTSTSPTPFQLYRSRKTPLQSRVGHSMLLDSLHHQLYIFGGERADNYFYDLHQYDIDTDTVSRIVSPQHRKHQKKKKHQHSDGDVSGDSNGVSRRSSYQLSSSDSGEDIDTVEKKRHHYLDGGDNDKHDDDLDDDFNDGDNDDDDDEDDGNSSGYDDDIGTMSTEEDGGTIRAQTGGSGSYYYYRGGTVGSGGENGLAIGNMGPDLGYTQRATMDAESKQVWVFSGYLRNTGCKTVKNVLRIYHLDRNVWEEVYTNERCHQSSSVPSPPSRPPPRPQTHRHYQQRSSSIDSADGVNATGMSSKRASRHSPSMAVDAAIDYPTPRFSCQWIYDETTKTHYLFGGDPHEYTDSDRRLGDLWKLKLIKPDVNSISQRCKYLIRVQQFKELCFNIEKNKTHDMIPQALDYLQTQVTPLVDSDNDQDRLALGRLCARLCLLGEEDKMINGGDGDTGQCSQQSLFLQEPADSFYMDRTDVYTELLKYFPSDMREPTGDISDALHLQ